jgi:hypothetical protein
MKRYYFPIILSGTGESPEEAWQEAVECFADDPGSFDYDDFTEEELEDEEVI